MSQTAAKPRTGRNRQLNGCPAARYLALIQNFPLRPLRSEREYDAALSVVDSLAVRPEGSLEPGEQDYFDTLTMLVEAYAEGDDAAGMKHGDALAMMRYIMRERRMTQAEVRRLL